MSQDWEAVKLGDICGFQNGFAFKSKSFKEKGTPVLRISSIQNEEICEHRPVFVDPNDYKENLTKYEVQDGDLLIAMSGATTGKIGFNRTGETYLLNQRVGRFIPSDQLNLDFLFLFLLTKVEDNLKISAGSAQPNLSTKQIKDFLIPLPPLPEQKRIVAILDKAFEGINQAVSNAEKNLANARELFESYLNTIFTKNEHTDFVPLSELTTDITDGDHSAPPKVPEGIPFITISNIDKTTRKIDFSDTFKVPEDYYHNLKSKRKPISGDVLYTVTGSYGIPVMIQGDEKFCFQRHIGLLRPKKKIDSAWLYYALLSPSVFQQATDGATGTAQKTVGLRVLRNIRVPKMNQKEQETIVVALDNLWAKTQRLQSIYQQKLSALQELKQSILQKAFSGELTADTIQ